MLAEFSSFITLGFEFFGLFLSLENKYKSWITFGRGSDVFYSLPKCSMQAALENFSRSLSQWLMANILAMVPLNDIWPVLDLLVPGDLQPIST